MKTQKKQQVQKFSVKIFYLVVSYGFWLKSYIVCYTYGSVGGCTCRIALPPNTNLTFKNNDNGLLRSEKVIKLFAFCLFRIDISPFHQPLYVFTCCIGLVSVITEMAFGLSSSFLKSSTLLPMVLTAEMRSLMIWLVVFCSRVNDNAPGGCGNDFALDDISFRECIIQETVVKNTPKTPMVKKQPEAPKLVVKKPLPAPQKKQPEAIKKPTPKKELRVDSNIIAKKKAPVLPSPVAIKPPESQVNTRPQANLPTDSMPALKQRRVVLAPPPPVVSTRSNPLIKRLETEAGEIKVDLYDNGQIDGDTVSVYHNNVLLISHAGLSVKPITFRIAIDAAHPHHELILVAHNLGSIPPNTSLMVVSAGTVGYEVFISSNEQKNAKVIFDLKE